MSPGLDFLKHFAAHRWESARHSGSRSAAAHRHAALAAVEGGLRFDAEDFREYEGSRHFLRDAEAVYRAAVESGNVPACHALERFLDRPPFLYKGKRLFVGAYLEWDGHRVRVTSFGCAVAGMGTGRPVYKPYLTACWYAMKLVDDHRLRNEVGVVRRYRITPAELREAEKKRVAKVRQRRGYEEDVRQARRAVPYG